LKLSSISSRDKLPSQKDYKNILIASVESSSDTDSAHMDGNVLDSNESTSWRAKGKDEYLIVYLSEQQDIRRIDIEWDAGLPREGWASIETLVDGKTIVSKAEVNRERNELFTVLETENKSIANQIKITIKGQETVGISTVAVYGYDLEKPRAGSGMARIKRNA
jgi:XRCC1 domain-containing protein